MMEQVLIKFSRSKSSIVARSFVQFSGSSRGCEPSSKTIRAGWKHADQFGWASRT
jgi:hypothetical protein